MKKYQLRSAASTLAASPGPKPPSQPLSMMAGKNSRKGDGPIMSPSASRASSAVMTLATATPYPSQERRGMGVIEGLRESDGIVRGYVASRRWAFPLEFQADSARVKRGNLLGKRRTVRD